MRSVIDSTNREIRVFISSTFRDMMRERDLLVKEVFPALRRKCAQRFVTLTEVDLRWGITEEQANEGKVLPLCLAEIERSRPYFIGLLGERYGWIPTTIDTEVIEGEPWLREHAGHGTSVTELEILHGVLSNPKMEKHAFFYFRDPAYIDDPGLTEDERRDMVERKIKAEVEEFGEEEASRRTEVRRQRLADLKQRIRESGFPFEDSYADPKALAEAILKQFDELIDRLYPQDETPDPLAQERLAHEAHANNKLFACIDRPQHLKALDDFANSHKQGGQGLVVTGVSGGGKTSLLAAWARDWIKNHPGEGHFLFQHYFGATPDSTSPEGFLHRLLGELKRRFEIADDIPTDPDELRDALPVWLAQAGAKTSIVLVLDGLNQVQGGEPDRSLRFLPRHFPPNVTVVASSLSGSTLDILRERGWAKHDLPLATGAEVDAMVEEYLAIHARTLEPELRDSITTAPASNNPLYLRAVLEELRQFGSFEELPDRVRHYLEADNLRDLFLRILARWQEDFDGKDPERDKATLDLVRRALTHLWVARQGLSESEMLDLLGDGDYPLPRALWAPLFFALEPHLSQRGGVFAFGHDFLRQAVEVEFLADVGVRRSAHSAMADYFEQHPQQLEMSARKASEWPFQLHTAEEWARLEACLMDIPLFLALYNDMTKWELAGYWLPLRQNQGRDMGACYTAALRKWSAQPDHADDHDVPDKIGTYLLENGLYSPAEPLLRQALEMRGRILGDEHPSTLLSVNNLAMLLYRKGDYAGARPLNEQVLETQERLFGKEHSDTLRSVSNLALLLHSQEGCAGARQFYERVLETRERVLGKEHPDTLISVNHVAFLLASEGDFAGSRRLYEQALEIQERVVGKDHPDTWTLVNGLAGALNNQGDFAGARSLYERALAARERILGKDHPETLRSVGNLALFLEGRGDYGKARPLCLSEC